MAKTVLREAKDSPRVQGQTTDIRQGLRKRSLSPSTPLFIVGGLLCAGPTGPWVRPSEQGGVTWKDKQVSSQASGRVFRRNLRDQR